MIHQFEIHQTREDVYARTADMNMSISEPNVRALEIHQTWKSAETLTTEMKHSISEWRRLHPHFVHRFWDDDACDLFMRTRYPELYATFADLPFGVQKADMFRVAVLHDRGGIYADTDVVPNVVIDESPLWPRADLLFASWELNQTNAFIVSKTPGHPLLLKALLCMQDRHARCRRWGLYHPMFTWLKTPVILYTTGPGAIRSSVGRPPACITFRNSNGCPVENASSTPTRARRTRGGISATRMEKRGMARWTRGTKRFIAIGAGMYYGS